MALASNLGYDAYYKIVNTDGFALTLFEKLNEQTTIIGFSIGKVKYVKKPIQITEHNATKIKHNNWEICFSKPIEYSEQQEYRMVFAPQSKREITPIILSCPDLLKFCTF